MNRKKYTNRPSRGIRPSISRIETFEKCKFLFEFKDNSAGQRNWTAVRLPVRARGMDTPSQRDNFNHRCPAGNALGVHTLSIPRIELKLHFVQNVESDAEIEQKGAFCKGLESCTPYFLRLGTDLGDLYMSLIL